jgi:hypothetical protein
MSSGPLAGFVSLLYRLAFRRCPIVFFQNPDDRDLFVARNIVEPSQARLLPGSGIDLDRFAPAPMPADHNQMTFLFIGRLLGDKGVVNLSRRRACFEANVPAGGFSCWAISIPATEPE